MKDNLFIFITVALLALFTFKILENSYEKSNERPEARPRIAIPAGLEPQEARYYKVLE